MQLMSFVARFRGLTWVSVEAVIWTLCFLIPSFLLTIKGVTNTFFLVFFLLSLWYLFNKPKFYFCKRGKVFWINFGLLMAPFFCELGVQILRGSIEWSSVDGPSRFLAASFIFVYLSRNWKHIFFQAFAYGSAVSIVITLLLCNLQTEYWWDHGKRLASHFVDPLTMSCFVVFLAVPAAIGIQVNSTKLNLLIKTLVWTCVAVIVGQTESRSAWVPFFLFTLFVIFSCKSTVREKFFLGLVIGCLTVLFCIIFGPSLLERAEMIYRDFVLWRDDSYSSTSFGGRLALLELDISLIRMSPFLGWPDGVLPEYSILNSFYPHLTPYLYDLKLQASSHTEITQKLVSMGLVFGSISFLATFILPITLFYRRLLCEDPNGQIISRTALIAFSTLFVSSMSIQVINLKMTSTIVAFSLALFLSALLRPAR